MNDKIAVLDHKGFSDLCRLKTLELLSEKIKEAWPKIMTGSRNEESKEVTVTLKVPLSIKTNSIQINIEFNNAIKYAGGKLVDDGQSEMMEDGQAIGIQG